MQQKAENVKMLKASREKLAEQAGTYTAKIEDASSQTTQAIGTMNETIQESRSNDNSLEELQARLKGDEIHVL